MGKIKVEVTDEQKEKQDFRKRVRSNFNPKSPKDRQDSCKVWMRHPSLRKLYNYHPEHHLYIYFVNAQGRPDRVRRK